MEGTHDGPGTLVGGRYRLETRAGEGGMAEVWRAVSLGAAGFRKRVALKRIHQHLADTETYRAMFVREACLTAGLDHSNIVQVFDLGEDSRGLYLVMEWVDGVTLKDMAVLCDRFGVKLSPALSCGIGISVLRALEAAHGHHERLDDGTLRALPVIHRDISPSNVLLSTRGDVKLADFGLARALDHSGLTPDGVVKGKLAYLAPEIVRGHPLTARSDLYSVGLLLWEMVCGRRLYAGMNEGEIVTAIVRGVRPPAVQSVNPDVPQSVAAVIEHALEPQPEQRIPTASAFARALGDALRRLPERTDNTRIAREVHSALTALQRIHASEQPPPEAASQVPASVQPSGHPPAGPLARPPARSSERPLERPSERDLSSTIDLDEEPLEDLTQPVDAHSRASLDAIPLVNRSDP